MLLQFWSVVRGPRKLFLKKIKSRTDSEFNTLVDFLIFKGTVSVISSDLPLKKGHPRFTTILFKLLTDQGWQTFSDLSKEI